MKPTPTIHPTAIRPSDDDPTRRRVDNLRHACPGHSLLAHDGHVYAVTDAGVAVCWRADSGRVTWQERLGGTFNASPVLAGGRLYLAREDGTTFVVRLSAEKLDVIAENKLGDEVFATPAVCGDHVFLRVAHRGDGRRREVLYCIGQRAKD